MSKWFRLPPRSSLINNGLVLLGRQQAMSFNAEMIACGLPKTLRNMKSRQWADPDIKEDVDALDT